MTSWSRSKLDFRHNNLLQGEETEKISKISFQLTKEIYMVVMKFEEDIELRIRLPCMIYPTLFIIMTGIIIHSLVRKCAKLSPFPWTILY